MQFLKLQDQIAMQVIVTGAPSSFFVALEVSLDGTNWSQANSVTRRDNPAGSFATIAKYIDLLVNYARANLVSFSGGASPTFTALIAARD